MSDLPQRLRDDLTTALRARDRRTIRVLRTALAAIANAEARPHVAEPLSLHSESPIAGATSGLAATEVDRRELGDAEIRAILAAERDERLTSAGDLAAHGAHEPAEELRTEAALLDGYLR